MAKILKNIDLANANLDSDQTLWVYNGMDTAITYEVWNNLRGSVEKRAITAYNFERGMLRPALTMMMRGLKIDEAAVATLVPELEAERALLMGLFADYCAAIGIDDPDHRSPIKLKKLFYVMLQIPEIRKSEKGVWKVSLDREALERISHEYPRGEPFARCLLALRDIDKQLDVLTCKRDEDGRFRSSYNVAGTETLRWSSSQSPFWTGGNSQNITDRLRKIVMPDDGMQLFYADLEQAESRAVAYLSGEEAYIAACENGDLHTTVAKMVWDNLVWSGNLTEDKATAEQPFYRHFSYRDLAKRGGHAKNYMITAMSMARRLRIPYRIAMRFELQYLGGEILQKDLERWHQQEPGGGFDLLIDTADDIFGEGDKRIVVVRGAFPGIRDWHDSVKEQLQTKGQLTTPFGMTRTFWGRPTEDVTLRGAVAHNPQSTIGCLLNVALYRLVNELEPVAPMQCLAQIHDAVLGQIPIGSEKELVPEIMKRMVNPLKVGDRMMSIPSSIELGGRWGKFDPKNPTDNPLGMRKFKL